jgi:phosphotransferase system enzyme I (PtsI)
MLKSVADVAKNSNTKLFICGEMASDPFNLPILLGLGMDELSMNPQSIPTAKNVIQSLNAADTVSFIEEVLKQKTAKDVTNLIQKHYGDVISAAVFQE